MAITIVKSASWSIKSPTHVPSLPIDVKELSKKMSQKKSVQIRNVEALSRNQCCLGKAINSKYSECVSVFFS